MCLADLGCTGASYRQPESCTVGLALLLLGTFGFHHHQNGISLTSYLGNITGTYKCRDRSLGRSYRDHSWSGWRWGGEGHGTLPYLTVHGSVE